MAEANSVALQNAGRSLPTHKTYTRYVKADCVRHYQKCLQVGESVTETVHTLWMTYGDQTMSQPKGFFYL